MMVEALSFWVGFWIGGPILAFAVLWFTNRKVEQ